MNAGAIVHTMPLSDLTAALYEASVGPRGKPSRVVASAVQVAMWRSEVASANPARLRPYDPWGKLNVMGIPVEEGADAQPELIWAQEVKTRQKAAA